MTKTLHDISAENEKQNWLKTGQNELSETMRGDLEIVILARNVITFLARYLGAQVGVLYLYDKKSDNLKLTASYAFNKRKSLNDTFKMGEGLVGQAALEQDLISITDIPEDYTRISSAIGDAIPRHVTVVPFVYEGTLKGVIELGAFQAFSDMALEFLRMVMENIAIGVNSSQSRIEMKKLLEKSQKQGEELLLQQEELRQTNDELEEQTASLVASEDKLQNQNRELQSANLALDKAQGDIEKKASRREKVEIAEREPTQSVPSQREDEIPAPSVVEEIEAVINVGFFKDKKVLLVDDDMRNVFALSHAFQKNGAEVFKAANGEDALEILDKVPSMDIVVVDIMMPVMDGYEAMRAIRAQDRFEHLPIIALSAKAMKGDREKSIAAGANDYLTKPVDVGQLLSVMRVWLNKY